MAIIISIIFSCNIKLMFFATLCLTKYMGQLARNYCIIDRRKDNIFSS